MGYYRRGSSWPEYVPVAEKKRQAAKKIDALEKKGIKLHPVIITGRMIAKTFWGKAWCQNLESYSDFSNRLPRGRTYVRNGSVIDLQITKGQIRAQVAGSSVYKVSIDIHPMILSKWQELVSICSGKIESLIELLQGKFSKNVMEILTEKERGLFPKPKEIAMTCSCPDYAGMCKHIAAVLYGVGAVLDESPEYLFQLRHVEHIDLIATASATNALMQDNTKENSLQEEDLSSLFGIEMDFNEPQIEVEPVKKKAKAVKKASVKKTTRSNSKEKKR